MLRAVAVADLVETVLALVHGGSARDSVGVQSMYVSASEENQ